MSHTPGNYADKIAREELVRETIVELLDNLRLEPRGLPLMGAEKIAEIAAWVALARFQDIPIGPAPRRYPPSILADIHDELDRIVDKWGIQNHRDGTGDHLTLTPKTRVDSRRWADYRREVCQFNEPGNDTWRDILLEEVAEALAEDHQGRLRAELVQVAAVAIQWIGAIDRRQVVS